MADISGVGPAGMPPHEPPRPSHKPPELPMSREAFLAIPENLIALLAATKLGKGK